MCLRSQGSQKGVKMTELTTGLDNLEFIGDFELYDFNGIVRIKDDWNELRMEWKERRIFFNLKILFLLI